MANVVYLKDVRTRYRNILYASLDEAKILFDSNIDEIDLEEQIANVVKCIEKINTYINKVEMQSEKLASALDPEKDEETDKLVKDDCELCYAAMEIFLDLKAYKGKLGQAKQNQQKLQSVQPEDPTSEALISLQQDMQKLMTAQLKQQQNEFSFRQEIRHEEKSSVKLPKLEMISFGGDKTRWVEFWDSFRNSVHNNSHISNVEKFNYLKSKLFGEARRSIAGLALSSENYSVAVDVLKDRFGNPQEIIDLHYNQLIHLTSANNKVASLRTLSDNIEKHLRSLQVLNQNIDQDVFVSIIRSKLPEEVLVQLEIQNGADKKWSVATLNKRLREYVIARERAEKRSRGQAEKQEFQQHNRVCDRTNAFTKTNAPRSSFTSHYNSSAQALVSANVKSTSEKGKEKQVMSKQDVKLEKRETYATKCRYCEGDHWSDECFNYKTLEERKRQLRGACYKCVKDGHKSQDCRANKKCVYCSKINSHHRSLCPEKFKVKETRVHMSEELRESPQAEQLEKRTVTPALISSNEMVLMQTAKTEIVNPSNSIRATTRLLLDSGSQRTYITERLASQLGLKGHTEEELKLVTFGSDKPKVIKTMSTSLNLKLNNSSFMTITANVVPTISGTIQRNVVPSSLSEQLQNLIHSVELADTLPSERETSTIEMLIGNDYYLDIVLPNRIEIQPGLYLLASKFGWILTGRTTEKSQDISEVNMFVMTYANDVTGSNVFTSLDPSMKVEPELQDFWRLETIGIRDEIEVTNDEVAMKKFRDTLTFQNDRYQVTWPWREEEFDLPVNRQLAMGRLKSAVSRLSDKPKLMEKYNKILADQLNQGIIEKVDYKQQDGLLHYLPHQPVITPQKNTTKLRIVYDASAKTKKQNLSLNECMYRGPVILQDICGMLIRFRIHRVAIVADIEKAFLQIGLQNDQRDVTRFLWLKNTSEPVFSSTNIQEYRFCRVPFGIIASPFLLGATIQCHLELYNNDIAEKVKNNIYVDNLITGTDTDFEGIAFYNGAKEIFRTASMNLREWASNSDILNAYIPKEDKAEVNSLTVLGMCWDPQQDTVSLKPITRVDETTTKRSVLKRLAVHYDPLGLFSPVLLRGKLLIQRLWSKGISWDKEVPDDMKIEWNEIETDLENISNVKIPRCLSPENGIQSETTNLVCFCDASEKAYSCVIYIHKNNSSSQAELIFAKSRLAPMKSITIPRLELMGVLIGVRCMKFVQAQIRLAFKRKYLFTDSQCVLKWMSSEKELPVFVKNRVREINQENDIAFEYVKSTENPADSATRGTNVCDLKNNTLWWYGPEWLGECEDKWPHNSFKVCKTDLVNETCQSVSERNVATHVIKEEKVSIKTNSPPFGIDSTKYSSITKLFRVTALALRFIRKLKKIKPTKSGSLTSTEISEAEHTWIIYVQRNHYADIFTSMHLKKRSNLQSQLNLYVDEEGILRCQGRLQESNLTEGSKHPILLPKNDRITQLLVEKCHKQFLHCGVSQTLSQLRYRYWVPQGRATVKAVLRQCLVCRRWEGAPYKLPNMPQLPQSRLTESQPYTHTGIDYLGPLYVKVNGEKQKVWICLYTCLVTRAIHLELMQDMTTEEFLLGFRRFISQRGTPVEIISDNALYFKTANRVLDSVWASVLKNEDVQSFCSDKKIKWSFIVELALWKGGFYERLVALVKRSLRKALGNKLLGLVQMQTVLKEIEASINSRPLVYVGNDINSSITLTPSHFLTLNRNVCSPDIDQNEDDYTYKPTESTADALLKKWHKGQKLLSAFWKI